LEGEAGLTRKALPAFHGSARQACPRAHPLVPAAVRPAVGDLGFPPRIVLQIVASATDAETGDGTAVEIERGLDVESGAYAGGRKPVSFSLTARIWPPACRTCRARASRPAPVAAARRCVLRGWRLGASHQSARRYTPARSRRLPC